MIHIRIEISAKLWPMKKLRVRLAKRLKEIKGLETQALFSRRIGIGQASLNRILNREQSATLDMLETICDRLKIDISELLKRD